METGVVLEKRGPLAPRTPLAYTLAGIEARDEWRGERKHGERWTEVGVRWLYS